MTSFNLRYCQIRDDYPLEMFQKALDLLVSDARYYLLRCEIWERFNEIPEDSSSTKDSLLQSLASPDIPELDRLQDAPPHRVSPPPDGYSIVPKSGGCLAINRSEEALRWSIGEGKWIPIQSQIFTGRKKPALRYTKWDAYGRRQNTTYSVHLAMGRTFPLY